MSAFRLPMRSFRTQAALVYGGLVALLAIGLAVVLAQMLRSTAHEAAGAALQVVARSTASQLAEGMGARMRTVSALAAHDSLWRNGLDSPAVQQAIVLRQAIDPAASWIGVTDTRGKVVSASGGLLVGVDVSAREWFDAGRHGSHVGDVHGAVLLASQLPRRPGEEPLRFVDFAAPIRVDGRLLGVLGLHGSWAWAREVVESMRSPADRAAGLEVFIFDRDGRVIHAAEGTTTTARDGDGQTLPLQPSTSGTPQAAVVGWADGRDYLSAAAPVLSADPTANLGWTVVARQPVETAFATARAGARQALLIGLVAALLACAAAFAASAKIARPLSEIAEAARAVDAGAEGARIPLQRSSIELEQLSGALAGMTQRLVEAKLTLEQRVAERTAALAAAVEELDLLARHDALTGLLNRRAFEEQAERLFAMARRSGMTVSVLVIDIDHFKKVNDLHGHDAGDRALKAVADVMHQRLRTSDVLARLGGEEFVALLPDTDEDGAREVAQSIVRRVGAAKITGIGRLTVSVGVACSDNGAEHRSLVLQRADAALYIAKTSGRNRVAVADAHAGLTEALLL